MNQGALLKPGLLDYQQAWDLQKELQQRRIKNECSDTLILTEHPHTYTIGKGGGEENLVASESSLKREGIKVYRIERGGDITYHGPGQVVGYPILDLHDYYLDTLRFLRDLEEVIILTLKDYSVEAGRIEGLTGVWVDGEKIAALGVKMSRWVTMHGFAFNINPDLAYYQNIIPCGIADKPVTSLKKILGKEVVLDEVEEKLVTHFSQVFQVEFEEKNSHEGVLLC